RHRLAAESVTRWPDPDLYIEPDRWERGHRPLDVHPDPERQLAWRIYATTAMHSISTRAPNARPLPATVERAGGSFGKNVAYTTFIAASSLMSARNTVHFTARSNELPAEASTVLMFSSAWRG